MLSEIVTSTLTFILTAYAPACGGINGSASRSFVTPQNSLKVVACGFKYPLGTKFLVKGLAEYGISDNVPLVCVDRGGWVYSRNLDLLVYSGNCRADRRLAYKIGRKKVKVEVILNK